MNQKFTLTIFLMTTVYFNCGAQILKKNVLEKPSEENMLEGRIFQVLLFAKENTDSSSAKNEKNYFSEFKEPLTSNKVILSFENDSLKSAWVGKNKFEECSKIMTTQEGNITAFTSNCISSTCVSIKAIWSGIVKRNTIQGAFCWVLPDGKPVNYTFYGKERKRTKDNQKINRIPAQGDKINF